MSNFIGLAGEKSITCNLSIGKGNDGHTPVKGVDYFTEEDISLLGIDNKLEVSIFEDHILNHPTGNLEGYYTEQEVDERLSGKSDIGHIHSEYSNVNHIHSEYATSQFVESELLTKSDVEHMHSEYSLGNHSHTDLQNQINETNSQLEAKVNKSDKITSSQLAIDTNGNKIKLINLADEVQQAMTGNAPALSTILPSSIGIEKLGINKKSKNLLNKNTCTQGKKLDYKSFNVVDDVNYYLSDYVPVSPSTAYYCNKTYGYAFYDSSLENLISDFNDASPGWGKVITTPNNAYYVRINIYKDHINAIQFEKGTSGTDYENFYEIISNKYIEKHDFSVSDIPDRSIDLDKIKFITWTKNKFNMNTVSDKDYYKNYTNGNIEKNEYTVGLCYSDFISVDEDTTYIFNNFLHSYCCFDKDLKYVTGKYTNSKDYIVTVPTNCKYIVLNSYFNEKSTSQFELGSIVTNYSMYGYTFNYMMEKTNKETLSLPEKYELVVGDTFELFYKGIILSNNPYNYNFKITCAKGSVYSRRYIYTPILSDVGTHNLTISVYDDNEKLLDSKTVKLIVKAKATSPSTVKNILCVGDSLTQSGVWLNETYRRLTSTGGTPIADGLTNIAFIGSLSGTNGAKYEGYGGWTYSNYNTNAIENQMYWISTTANKPVAYQKSKWRDSNNIVWVLETLESTRIKVYRDVYGSQLLPSTGSLTWVSGGDGSNNTAISYTSVNTESGNPFWDNVNNKVDFKVYTTKVGATSIDYVYVLLGWNSTNDSETTTKANIRTFINNVRTSFPDCKVGLMGLQVPSLDGFGENYGTSWNYYDKLKFVFNYNKWNLEVSKEYTGVDFVNIAGQFDTENNCSTSTRKVNARNSKTETYQNNGVHPSVEGQMQIGDAIYRNLTHKL